MSQPRSLGRVLAAQWVGFALALAGVFIALGLLLLYVLEDSFIDRRLRDAAARITRLDAVPALPERFRLFREANLPADLRVRFADAEPGAIAEFRRHDGRYVHVLWTQAADGRPYALLYDASDELTVNAGIARGWPYLLPLLAGLALAAYFLSRRFIGQVTHTAADLLRQLRAAPDPAALRAFAAQTSISEFASLARLGADAWEARLAALERERSTLAFLAHELRTPLQSARTSLALLQDDRADVAAWQRLQRALDRLGRASNCLLWLASDAAAIGDETTPIADLLGELVEEFAPLAAARRQTIVLNAPAAALWPLRRDAAEALFANLLLNALQHGAAGSIRIEVSATRVRIGNPCPLQAEGGGFGLGLKLVERLAERFALKVTVESAGDWRWVGVACAAGTPPPQAELHGPMTGTKR